MRSGSSRRSTRPASASATRSCCARNTDDSSKEGRTYDDSGLQHGEPLRVRRAGVGRVGVLGGKPIALGTDRNEALRRVLDLTGKASDEGTIAHCWRLYQES